MRVSIEMTNAGLYVRFPWDPDLNEDLRDRGAQFDKQGQDRAWILPESEGEAFAAYAERQGHEITWE